MLFPFWLFLFNAYFVYALRSNTHDHFKKSNYQNSLSRNFNRGSRLKTTSLEFATLGTNHKSTEDQLIAEESNDDQQTAVAQKRFEMPEMDSWSMPTKKVLT